jgi:hypothetical protein
MWEPRSLTPLWAFAACYRDSFTLLTLEPVYINIYHLVVRSSYRRILYISKVAKGDDMTIQRYKVTNTQ